MCTARLRTDVSIALLLLAMVTYGRLAVLLIMILNARLDGKLLLRISCLWSLMCRTFLLVRRKVVSIVLVNGDVVGLLLVAMLQVSEVAIANGWLYLLYASSWCLLLITLRLHTGLSSCVL